MPSALCKPAQPWGSGLAIRDRGTEESGSRACVSQHFAALSVKRVHFDFLGSTHLNTSHSLRFEEYYLSSWLKWFITQIVFGFGHGHRSVCADVLNSSCIALNWKVLNNSSNVFSYLFPGKTFLDPLERSLISNTCIICSRFITQIQSCPFPFWRAAVSSVPEPFWWLEQINN